MPSSVNIVFISGDPDMQQLVQMILEPAQCGAVKSAASLDEIATLVKQQTPDLVVLEFTAFISDCQPGFPVYHQIKAIEERKDTPVLFWMVPNPKQINPEARRLGVAGWVKMPSQPQELIEACKLILAGGTYYPDEDKSP